MSARLRYLFGWILLGFRRRAGLVLENLALRQQLLALHAKRPRPRLVKFVEHRVADPRILRLIQKWLKAGVMEDCKWSETKTGTPIGQVACFRIA